MRRFQNTYKAHLLKQDEKASLEHRELVSIFFRQIELDSYRKPTQHKIGIGFSICDPQR